MKRGLFALAVCLWTLPSGKAQIAATCNPQQAEQGGFLVDRIVWTGPLSGIPLPLREHEPFRMAALTESTQIVSATLQARPDGEELVRFRLVTADVACTTMDPVRKTVVVEVRTDRIVVPEGDSAGEIMDEASSVRMEELEGYPRMTGRFDADRKLGEILGIQFETREFLPGSSRQHSQRLVMSGWKSNKDFYHIGIDSVSTSWETDPRGMHIGAQIHGFFDKTPFADGTLKSNGVTVGAGYEWQTGQLNLRVNVDGRYTRAELDRPAGATPGQNELALQISGQQEFTIRGGFLRLGGWFDRGTAYGSKITFNRGGGFMRVYEDLSLGRHSSMVFDLTASGGVSGLAPWYRSFTGGNRIDPFLAQHNYPEGEFVGAGPILRGYGVTGFYLPLPGGSEQVSRPFTTGGNFRGISFTLGLPGFSTPLVDAVDGQQKASVDAAMRAAFDRAVGDIMALRLREGASVDAAERSSLREGRELRDVLQNLIRHGRRLSLRPLIAVDAATLQEATSASAVSLGTGFRLAALNWGVEALGFYNTAFGSPGSNVGYSFLVRVHFRQALGSRASPVSTPPATPAGLH